MINIHTIHRPPSPLMQFPDVYFSTAYGKACASDQESTWIMVEALDGRWQIPLVLRPTINGATDAASPYGYSGVYASETLNSSEAHLLWDSTVTALRDIGVISAFLRHSPIVPQAPPNECQRFVVRGHPTILIRLTSTDSIWNQMEGRCRTAIRKALKGGVRTSIQPATDALIGANSEFRRLYDQSMVRKGAGLTHLFSDEHYKRLRIGLESNLLVGEALSPTGEVLTTMLLMRHGETFHYHLSASAADAASTGSNNLMLWDALQHATQTGGTQFHLGGGLRAGDSLYKFKRSFGGDLAYYNASGLIIDSKRYKEEVQAMPHLPETPSPGPDIGGFFPAYRSTIQSPIVTGASH